MSDVKSITHTTFSAGLSFYLALHTGFSLLYSLILAIWLSLAINWVIDALGHRNQDGRPVRTFLTHSIFLAPLWGGLVGYTSFVLANAVLQLPSAGLLALFSVLLGAFIAILHLFLDSLTEGGVYWRVHRVAIAHARYNDPLLNGSFILLGLLFLAASFLGH